MIPVFFSFQSHFDNQILDYATRKILVRHAIPTPLADTKYSQEMINARSEGQEFDHVDLDEDDEDYAGGSYSEKTICVHKQEYN